MRYSLAWPDCFFRYLWWQKNGKTRSIHARLCARVAMEEGLLSVWVSQTIGQSQLVDEYCCLLNLGVVRTRLQILCSCLSGKRRIGDPVNVFSWTTSMKVIHESFLLRTIPNIRYVLVYAYHWKTCYGFRLLTCTNSNQNGVTPYRWAISVNLVSVQ